MCPQVSRGTAYRVLDVWFLVRLFFFFYSRFRSIPFRHVIFVRSMRYGVRIVRQYFFPKIPRSYLLAEILQCTVFSPRVLRRSKISTPLMLHITMWSFFKSTAVGWEGGRWNLSLWGVGSHRTSAFYTERWSVYMYIEAICSRAAPALCCCMYMLLLRRGGMTLRRKPRLITGFIGISHMYWWAFRLLEYSLSLTHTAVWVYQ